MLNNSLFILVVEILLVFESYNKLQSSANNTHSVNNRKYPIMSHKMTYQYLSEAIKYKIMEKMNIFSNSLYNFRFFRESFKLLTIGLYTSNFGMRMGLL